MKNTLRARISLLIPWALCLLGVVSAPPAWGDPEVVSLAEESLRAAETAFAQSMADRDHATFVSFLAEDAVFFGDKEVYRGREAVAAAWKPFFEGDDAPFSWAPEAVAVISSGLLGLSSGPVNIPDGTRVGTFNSTWRNEDGQWKVVFDRGCPGCECP
jgi:ketosteroid isomerase-like protein